MTKKEKAKSMAQFINKKEDIVQEAINGLVAASGGALSRLDGFPFIRVVLRSDWDKTKVAVVSGGGAGHEPAHAGFVGKGMLAAAVCGDVFASPSVDAILAGIRAVTGQAGCVLVVKNYTGDRLNFGLAAARARELGLMVNMVIVEDDISLPDLPQPRGVAGTLFVHKIAGAISESGGDLAAVTKAAERAAKGATTIGMALRSCTVPGSKHDSRIAEGEIELGLGIHGEPGAEQLAFVSARQAIGDVIQRLQASMTGDKYVALLNNLGGTTALEMGILAHELHASSISSKISHIVGPASMMTALDMHGFSVSLYPASDEDIDLLSRTTPVSTWPPMRAFNDSIVFGLPENAVGVVPPASSNPKTAVLISACCSVLIASEQDLNEMDAKTGDGDTGTTVATAAREILNRLDQLPLADLTQLLPALSRELTQTMGGSSGILLAIFFSAAGEATAAGNTVKAALQFGLTRVKDVGGARLGDRTMIDALEPALEALSAGFVAAATAAQNGADNTKQMSKANAGRSSYINAAQLEGHVDPGAEAVARVFKHLAKLERTHGL